MKKEREPGSVSLFGKSTKEKDVNDMSAIAAEELRRTSEVWSKKVNSQKTIARIETLLENETGSKHFSIRFFEDGCCAIDTFHIYLDNDEDDICGGFAKVLEDIITYSDGNNFEIKLAKELLDLYDKDIASFKKIISIG